MLPRSIAASVLVLVVVSPVAYMLVPQSNGRELEDLLTSVIAALAVTAGVMVRRRSPEGTWVAALLGVSTGLLMAVVIGSTNARGFGVLIPPTAGLALGLLDGIGERPLQGFKEPVGYGVVFGILISLGLIQRQGSTVWLVGAVIGAVIGVFLGMRRDPDLGWRGGLRRPPWPFALMVLALLALFTSEIRGEFEDGRSRTVFFGAGWPEALLQTVVMQVLIPVLFLTLGIAIARWLRPRLAVYGELVDYLRVMYVPIGAFSLGSAFIVMVFAGIYGSLFRMSADHFVPMAQDPSASDWVFFAIYTSVAADFSAIAPRSTLAHLTVAGQVLIGIGWAVVMFAAVMTLMQPRLARLSGERRRQ